MPFHTIAAYQFTQSGIGTYASSGSGVYGIYNGRCWIYVNEALDIKSCLLAQLSGSSEQSASLLARKPAYFIFERCHLHTSGLRKAQLILEYTPCCNKESRQSCEAFDSAGGNSRKSIHLSSCTPN
jgi:hypothetical protein